MHEAPHIPTREEVLKAGYKEEAVDGIIANAKGAAARFTKAQETTVPTDLAGAAEILNRYGNVGKDPEELLKHRPRPDQLATACAVAIGNGVPEEAVKASYVLFMDASKIPAPEAGELFENAMRGIELPVRGARRTLDSVVTPTQVHYTCPECKAQHTVTREGLQSSVITCVCGCQVSLSL